MTVLALSLQDVKGLRPFPGVVVFKAWRETWRMSHILKVAELVLALGVDRHLLWQAIEQIHARSGSRAPGDPTVADDGAARLTVVAQHYDTRRCLRLLNFDTTQEVVLPPPPSRMLRRRASRALEDREPARILTRADGEPVSVASWRVSTTRLPGFTRRLTKGATPSEAILRNMPHASVEHYLNGRMPTLPEATLLGIRTDVSSVELQTSVSIDGVTVGRGSEMFATARWSTLLLGDVAAARD
jgi:hypothetical protein